MSKPGAETAEQTAPAPVVYQFAKRPKEISFCQFVYNNETGEILGRTPVSWFKITLFYIIYYSFLSAFFIVMLLAFFRTLDDTQPTWKMESGGLIGSNPAMGFRPGPPDNQIESTLIWFRHGSGASNWEQWVERLEDYVKDYENETTWRSKVTQEDCGDLAVNPPGRKSICKVKPTELFQGNCTREHSYGFKDGRPCILLKMNRIIGWTPTPLDPLYLNEFEDLPKHLAEQIKKNKEDGNDDLNKRVWIDCQGENPADKENMGEIIYHPTNGISENYFPYENQEGYLSPAIFVEFTNPKHGVMIAVECKAWAENIKHDRMERRGLAHFELMID